MSSPSTRLRLINQWGPCPPDGYRYRFPSTGFVCHAWTYVDWVQAAKNHLQANNVPVPSTLQSDMEEQLCLTLPPGWCLYDDPNRVRPSVSLSWDDVVGGIKTFSRWIASGLQYVPQAEANRRALICSRCYLNVNVQGCAACQKIAAEVVADKSTKHDQALRACAVCKCLLRAKVHFPISTLDTSSPGVQQMYPEFCWLKQGGTNYHAQEKLDSERRQPKT